MRIVKLLRSLLRTAAALFWWLNALMIFRPRVPFSEAAHYLGLETPTLAVITIIVALSVASAYGVRNYALDVLYIAGFPFVLAWKVAVGLFWLMRWGHRTISLAIPTPDTPMKMSDTYPIWRTIAKVEPDKAAETPKEKPKEILNFKQVLIRVGKALPFWRFTLIWGLLIMAASNHKIVVAGLVFLIIGLVRSGLRLGRAASRMKSVNETILGQAGVWISTLVQNAHGQNPGGSLLLLKAILIVVGKTREAYEAMILLGVVIASGLYSWLALAFYFLYLGVAKLTLPSVNWPTLFDSVFFPIMGGNIAQNWGLKVAVVAHWVALAFVGYLIWRFLAGEIRRLQRVARWFEEQVETKLQALAAAPPVVDVQPAPADDPLSSGS